MTNHEIKAKKPKEAKEKMCKPAPSKMTQDKLKKLRHEVEQGKISKNPKDYNYPETKLDKKDTLRGILNKIFSNKGKKAPKGSVQRIELALTTNGVDLDKLRDKDGVDSWKVENGELIMRAPKKKGKATIFVIDVLPWKALEAVEILEENRIEYALGKYKGAPKPKTHVRTVEGSVDATTHYAKLKKQQVVQR